MTDVTDETPRQALHDAGAEAAVLSACLIDPGAVVIARNIVRTPQQFYGFAHQLVWAAMQHLVGAEMAIDPVTLGARLEATGDLTKVGGKAFISELINASPTAANVEYHARVVRELADRREILGVANALMRNAQDRTLPLADLVAQATSALTPVAVQSVQTNFVSAKAKWWETLAYLERLQTGEVIAGLTTGWPELDRKLCGGPIPGEVVSIIGVPGSGKTAFAINWATHAMLDRGVTCAIVSAEMRMRQLMVRQLNMVALVRTEETRTGKFPDGAWRRIHRAAKDLAAQDLLYVDDTSSPTIEDVIAKCTLLKQRVPALQYVFFDFMQLIKQASRRTGDLESSELKAVSQGIAQIAKDLDVVSVVLVQPNDKQIKERADKRPQLEDVQGTSGIRQVSHFMLLCYRPAQYDPTNSDDTFEVNIGKAREIAGGTVKLRWDGPHVRVFSEGRDTLDELRRRDETIAPELALTGAQ